MTKIDIIKDPSDCPYRNVTPECCHPIPAEMCLNDLDFPEDCPLCDLEGMAISKRKGMNNEG